MTRRSFLRVLGVGIGVLAFGRPLAAQEAIAPAQQETLEAAVARVLGVALSELEPSDEVRLDVPAFVENAVNVPVRIESLLEDDVTAIHFFADRNPFPHVFSVSFASPVVARTIETRVRLAASAPVRAIVEVSDGRKLMAVREVGVGVGGC